MKKENHVVSISSPNSADNGSPGRGDTAHAGTFERILEILSGLMEEKFSGSIQIIYEEGQVRRVKRSEQLSVTPTMKNRVRVKRFKPAD